MPFLFIGYSSFINVVDRDYRARSPTVGGALARWGRHRPEVPRMLAPWGGPKTAFKGRIRRYKSEWAPRLPR